MSKAFYAIYAIYFDNHGYLSRNAHVVPDIRCARGFSEPPDPGEHRGYITEQIGPWKLAQTRVVGRVVKVTMTVEEI